MAFLKSLVSKKLAVTAAMAGLVQSLPLSADVKGACLAALGVAYVLAQAYVDAQTGSGSGPETPAA
jgi:hypothetical protein